MTASKEKAVRSAAKELGEAIAAAVAAGYRVEWPASPAGLGAIGISATAAVAEEKPAKAAAAKAAIQPQPVAKPDASASG